MVIGQYEVSKREFDLIWSTSHNHYALDGQEGNANQVIAWEEAITLLRHNERVAQIKALEA